MIGDNILNNQKININNANYVALDELLFYLGMIVDLII